MLITLLIILLLSNALTSRRDKSILFSRTVILGLVSTTYLTLNNLFIESLGKGIGIYGGLFNVTCFTQTFNIFIFAISAVILTLTAFYPRKVYIDKYSNPYNLFFTKLSYNKKTISNKTGEQFHIREYPLTILFILSGAVFLMSSADLISVFLFRELQSYGLYILSTIYRNSESSTRSGLTYFLLGGLSSCFILLGSALLYANSGTSSLDNMYIITSLSENINLSSLHTNDIVNYASGINNAYQPYYLHLSLIIVFVGFLFKVSAAPFHFWSPDVYDGIPTIVTTFVAIIAKISIFAFFLELVYNTEYYFFDFSLKNILLLSSLFSLVIGSVLGLTQFRIKRLFAYSTISHVGFILLALSVNSTESIQSYIFYILQYSISNLNAFIILVTMGYSLYLYYKEKQDKDGLIDPNNSPIQLMSQIRGYFYINHFIAISLSITLFSFVGIPPVIGFFAKQMILSAALDNGYVFIVIIAILTSVIGAGYYLNLVKLLFFYKQEYKRNTAIRLSSAMIPNPAEEWHDTYDEDDFLIAYVLYHNTNNSGNKKELFHNTNNSGNKKELFKLENITLSSSLSSSISVITLLLILFIYMPEQWLNLVNILTLILFKG